MNRPNLPVSRLVGWTATLAGQLTGVLLVLAPAVTHPLPVDGAARMLVQLLAAVAGAVGVVIVAAGLLGEVGEDVPPQARMVTLPRPRVAWSVAGVVALALLAAAVTCLARTLGGEAAEYLPAAVMFALTALAAVALLWSTRGVWTPIEGSG